MGKVTAKQSVKFARFGDFVKTYTPKEMKNYAEKVKTAFLKEYPDHLPSLLSGNIQVVIRVFFEIPKSFTKKKKAQALEGLICPTVKPDWDNIAKNICDALNGIAYPDDKAIVSGHVGKYYADVAYVEVLIEECE